MTAKKPAPIVIRLTADGLKNVKSALSGAQKSVKALAAAIGKINTGIKATSKSFAVAGGAVSGLAAAFAATTRAGVESVAEQGRFAQQVGLSAEQYQKLRYAAEQAGHDVDGLNGFLINLADKSIDAANGSEGAAQQLADLGISAVDSKGRLKSMPKLVEDLADAVAKMPDGAKKTGLLSIFAGDDGARAIGWLNNGSRGLKRMAGEAEALGLVISDEQTAYAQSTKRSVDQLFSVVKSVRDELAMVFAPELKYQSEQLTDAILRNKGALKQLAIDAYNAAWAIGEELYNVLYLKKNPSTWWMQAALDIAHDLKAIFTGSGGPLKVDFLENARKSFVQFRDDATRIMSDVGKLFSQQQGIETPWIAALEDEWARVVTVFSQAEIIITDVYKLLAGQEGIQTAGLQKLQNQLKRISGAIDTADRVIKDFYRLFSNSGGIETPWIRDLEDDWARFSGAVKSAWTNIISPALTAFHTALGAVADVINSVFGLKGDARWSADQLAIAIAIGSVTGFIGTFVKAAKLALPLVTTLGRGLLAVAGAAGLVVTGITTAAAVINGIRSDAGDVAMTQEQVDKRVQEISAEHGEAAAAAYQRAYLAEYEKKWGWQAANTVANWFGIGTDVEDTKFKLDTIISSDAEAAKLGEELAAADLQIPAKLSVQDAELTAEVTAALDQIEAGAVITDIQLSPEAQKQFDAIQSKKILPPGSMKAAGFAVGGEVRGPGTATSDSIFARLSNGEFVMKAAAVKRWGVGFMERLNSGLLPAFASGGLVSMPAPAGLSSASAMLGGSSGRPVMLQLPDGSTTELRGQPDAVAQLERKLRRSVTAQAGRKPGWYK